MVADSMNVRRSMPKDGDFSTSLEISGLGSASILRLSRRTLWSGSLGMTGMALHSFGREEECSLPLGIRLNNCSGRRGWR